MIGRRETLRSAPKSFVFGLFEAIWDQNDLSHADITPRGDSDAFAGTLYMFDVFADVQPVASDHSRTAARVLGDCAPASVGHSRVVGKSMRDQRCVAPSTCTIRASLWLQNHPRARRLAAAWLASRWPVDARASFEPCAARRGSF